MDIDAMHMDGFDWILYTIVFLLGMTLKITFLM